VTFRQLIDDINGVLDMPTGDIFFRVCAEQMVDGQSVASSAWPGVTTLESARSQLDVLRVDPENARYTDWMILQFERFTRQTVAYTYVADKEGAG